jgi:hypothetical protein
VSRPPRVAFVMEQVLGHTTWSMNLRAALERLGITSVFVETRLFREGGVPERIPGVPTTLRAGARALIDVRQGLAGQRYEALVFNTQKAAQLCQPYLVRTPTLLMTDVTPLQYDGIGALYRSHARERGPIALMKRAATTLNFRLAAGLIGWSRWTADSFVRDYGARADHVHVVPPGVDTSLWRPVERSRSPRPRLLFVGGDFERKGGRELLEAFRDLRLGQRAELHLVTRDGVPAADGVFVHRLANGTAELRDLYASSDAFVLPTKADCFSIASIEAMASGLPVAVNDVGGIGDIVVDGETGFLLPSGDGRSLRHALVALVDDAALRLRLGAAGRTRATRMFDAAASASRILDIAAQAIAERQRISGSADRRASM